MILPVRAEDVKREVNILRALSGHENVVQFYNAFEDDYYVYIAMEVYQIRFTSSSLISFPVDLFTHQPVVVRFKVDPGDLQPCYPDYVEFSNDEEEDKLIKWDFNSPCSQCGKDINVYHRYYYKCTDSSCDYVLHKSCAKALPATLTVESHGLTHTYTLQQPVDDNHIESCHICRDEVNDNCLELSRFCCSDCERILDGFKGKVFWVRAKEVPGWIPDFVKDNDEEKDSEVGSYEEVPNREDVTNVEDLEGVSDREIVPDTKFEEDFPNQKGEEDLVRQGHFKNSEVPKSDGSILQLIDDLVKVGETMVELADCHAIIDKVEGENKVVNRRTEVVNLIQEMEKKNSLKAAQKAKIKWAIEGDEKSKYYHGVINKKRNPLSIRGILVERTWIDSPSLVKSKFLSHFKNRFEQPNSNWLHMNMHFSNTLSSVQGTDLGCQVSKEEIKKAAWDCEIDKSPSPDGFTFGFYHRYWKLIENDVVDAVTCLFYQGLFPKGDLGKSSGCGVGRSRERDSIGFVADKQILDCSFILNELVQWCKKKNNQSFVFKVDFEKAGSVIVNGSPTEVFQFYKGLKQGDPLSPFLFILVMERLHISFQRVVDVGLFKGIDLAPSLNLCHMFYADDAIFMEDDKVKQAAAKIGCNTLKTPFSYLGSKVGGCMSHIQSWNETIERMACQLSKWKLKKLSIGGRLTLLKSVLGSMPIFKVPKKVLHRMESMRSHFFSGAELSSKKLHSLLYVFETVQQAHDVPFGSYFEVHCRWSVENTTESTCNIDVKVGVHFKKWCPMQSKIKSGAIAEV
nr:hypothetical protein [Tanacetum cinerariifolium]